MSDRYLEPSDTSEPPCFCAPDATDPMGVTAESCPAHGDPDKPVPEPEDDEDASSSFCRELGEDEYGVVHHTRDPEGDEAAHG